MKTPCIAIQVLVAGLLALAQRGVAEEVAVSEANDGFSRHVAPFLKKYCGECHGAREPEGGVSLTSYRESANVQTDYEIWERVLRLLDERQMPPEDARQPAEAELRDAVASIKAELLRFNCDGQKHPGRVTIRRLNRPEYNNTIRDLIGIDFRPARDFPSDDVGEGFDNIADVLSIPPILLEKYLAAAEMVVDQAWATEMARSRILVHGSESPVGGEVTRRNLSEFASRAFRRPATADELDRLLALIHLARQEGSSDEEALRAAFQAILASPHFLFRIEADPDVDDPDGIRELNDFELASRLSYFLWSSMPDDELFQLAREASLGKTDILHAQVKRMLADPKAQALTKNFAGQWLQLRSLADMDPDPELFPEFDAQLRAASRRETELFFECIVREDRSVLEFLNADFSFVNERLARHYNMDGISGSEFQRVGLPVQRRGVLTQASVLLLTSNPTRTSPVKRGKWILENILGEPPPPPPEGIEPLQEGAVTLGTLRERMQQHRDDESCAVCHRKMDSLGFGLENYDATGAWRDQDGRFAIDPSGALPGGREFQTPKELMEILAEDKQEAFSRCLAEKMLTYALGRGLHSYDRCTVDEIVKQLSLNDHRFGVLIAAIVTSDPFTMREVAREM